MLGYGRISAPLALLLLAPVALSQTQIITVDDADISIAYVTNPKIASSRWTAVNAANGVNTTCNTAVHCFSEDG